MSTVTGSRLGDFVRCLGRLRPDDDATVAVLASAFGLGLKPPPAPREAPRPDAPAPNRPARTAPDPPPTAEAHLPPRGVTPSTPRALHPRSESAPGPSIPARVGGWTAEPPPLQPTHHPSLLHPRRERAILRAAVTSPRPDGPVDAARLIDDLSRGRPIRRLPRQARWSSRGVDVLVHTSAGMQPFDRDRRLLIERLRRLVGSEALRVWHFHRRPTALFERRAHHRYRVSPERAVVLLTDLNAVGAHRPLGLVDDQAWAALARELGRAPTAIALSPYGTHAGLTRLDRTVPVVLWDEPTTPRDIRRAQRGRGQW